MAEIIPFEGAHYAASGPALAKLVCPPYDVISPEERDSLYARDPRNYVRLILNRPEPGDDPAIDTYRRAGGYLREWLSAGVLVRDRTPSLYEYCQTFTHPTTGARLERSGFFCALKLEPYSAGVVLPHEETRTKAKEDRLRLMRATAANPEPIFALYDDPADSVAGWLHRARAPRNPDLDVEVDGDRHSVWRIAGADVIESIQRYLADRRIWIADGHHRYETALAYRDERRAAEGETTGPQPYDYILTVLSSFSGPGLAVLPTHRLVRNVPEGRVEQLMLQLSRYFAVMPASVERTAASMTGPGHRIGMVSKDGTWILSLKQESMMDAAVEDHSAAWKRLDVAILQALVLERSLGIPAASLAASADIGYTRDRAEAIERVRSGEYQFAFMLNDPTADEIREVSAAGDKMPAKSTYFYPKLWSGLILRMMGTRL